jgi:2-(1,2-epoxy-1,2-dihydrophenyl)acetyl-CoA isomerase
VGDHFCGGADIIARNAASDQRPRAGSIQRRLPEQAHRLIPLLMSVQIPVVCGVQGWAAGIGFQLALAADFTIAADDARFWEPFASRGFTPDSGATWLLPRRVGPVRARELLLLGRALSGVEAAEWGLIHRSVPAAELDRELGALAIEIVSGPTVALGLTKWLLHEGSGLPLEGHLANEAFALELSSRTEDFREGLAAFRERRDPRFEGR